MAVDKRFSPDPAAVYLTDGGRALCGQRLVPVPTIPETTGWDAAERARTARVLSHQLAELLSLYGSAVTLEALALALKADMQPAAEAIGAERLSAMYDASATMVRGIAAELERRELERT